MRCPTLADLPAPPEGKIGWPWTVESQQMPAIIADGQSWPKITIVTPSYNQGQFLEETIRSVLLQGYPNLEYIIIDGGSVDESVNIIKRYESWCYFWVSEKDSGQSSAIAKGFERATGEIQAWLNSDDLYNINSFKHISKLFEANQDVQVIYGNRYLIDEESRIIGNMFYPSFLTSGFWGLGQPVAQEATFWRTLAYKRCGGIDKSLFFAMDYDLFLRMFKESKFKKLNKMIGMYRNHAATKSSNFEEIMWAEFRLIKKLNNITDVNPMGIKLNALLIRLLKKIEEITYK